MSNYLLELSIMHLILMAGYWLFLRNERKFALMRWLLIGFTLLVLVIPLLKLPELFHSAGEATMAPAMEINAMEPAVMAPEPGVPIQNWGTNVLLYGYLIISTFFMFRFVSSIIKIIKLKASCSYEKYHNLNLYTSPHIKGSFSFFRWIFIHGELENSPRDFEAILKHEKAHVNAGHTWDILFFELFKVAFWWLPTAWFINNEIRKIHEYQADAGALKSLKSVENYSSVLINSTLQSNGLSLASSFHHHSLILKRLKAMKQQTKNVKPWKLGALAVLVVSLFVIFACTEEMDQEIKEMGSQSNAITFDQLPAEMQHELENLQSQLSFLKVEVPEGKNTSEMMELQNLDPKLIHYIQVDKDKKTLYLALKKDEANFNALSEKSKMEGEIFTVVEDQPTFKGGMQALSDHLASNLQYPAQARQQGIEGRVFVQFVVEKDGSLSNVTSVKGIGGGCDEEAVRVLKESPKWKPGKQRGKPVKVRMILPITFNLGEDESKTNTERIVIDDVKTQNSKFTVDASYSYGEWSGTIYDEEGSEMAGVNIIVHNTSTGTVSDLNGAFKLKADESQDLYLSFVGYESVLLESK